MGGLVLRTCGASQNQHRANRNGGHEFHLWVSLNCLGQNPLLP
jgi:hypothetical protein